MVKSDMTPKELEQYLKVCRRHGVSALEVGGVKVVLDAHYTPTNKQAISSPSATTPQEDELTDEDILLWSSTPPAVE